MMTYMFSSSCFQPFTTPNGQDVAVIFILCLFSCMSIVIAANVADVQLAVILNQHVIRVKTGLFRHGTFSQVTGCHPAFAFNYGLVVFTLILKPCHVDILLSLRQIVAVDDAPAGQHVNSYLT